MIWLSIPMGALLIRVLAILGVFGKAPPLAQE